MSSCWDPRQYYNYAQQCYYPPQQQNRASCCSSPSYYSSCPPPFNIQNEAAANCCPPMSKLACFANGMGSMMQNDPATYPRRPPIQRQQCQEAANCCPGRGLRRNPQQHENVSAVFYPARGGPCRNPQQHENVSAVFYPGGRSNNKNCTESPATRLKNVDILEELSYFTHYKDPCSACPPACYDYCNPCDPMDCFAVCFPQEQPGPPEPVTYSRRQRFNFVNPADRRENTNRDCEYDQGPAWPFDNNGCGGNYENRGNRQNCCGGGGRRNGRPRPAHRTSSFDETPVGKNPVPKPKGGDDCCCCCCCDDKSSVDNAECEKKLPKVSGVYYFNKTRGEFVEHIPEVQIFEAPPPPPPEELIEEETQPDILVQPIIQQMMMPNPCNPCCNPCYNPCNPCCNPCGGNSLLSALTGGGMGMMGGGVMNGGILGMGGMGMGGLNYGMGGGCGNPGIVPMCIPMCNQYGLNCTQQVAPPPAPNYAPPPNYPPPPPPMRPPKQKKKKKSKKRHDDDDEEVGPLLGLRSDESPFQPLVTAVTDVRSTETVTTIFVPTDAGDVVVEGDGDGEDEE